MVVYIVHYTLADKDRNNVSTKFVWGRQREQQLFWGAGQVQVAVPLLKILYDTLLEIAFLFACIIIPH